MGDSSRISYELTETIQVRNGQLVFERDGARVPVVVSPGTIRIGCHRITFEAWHKLKQLIEGK
jgi:hypothetical protein